jgi:hypothetical protein
VLGPIPRDQVVTHAGERFEKYGCVMYTAVALSALLDAGDTIVPISHVRRRDEGPIKQILGSFPNIDTSGITSPADQGDVVELRYVDQNRRVERQANFMNPILPADVDQVLDADAFVCVPITDYEVGQPTLRHIKEHSRATVVLDAHGPTTTLTRSGERHPRVWADQDLWLPYIDILKMNLDEAGSARLGESAEAAADPPRLSDEELRGLAHHCLDRGVGAVCVTLRRVWLRCLLPGQLRRGRWGVRRSHRGGARRGHDRCRRLVRRGTGLRLPRLPGLRRGLPVRECDGRSALYRHGTERLSVTRRNGAADPRGVRPSTAGGTSLNIPAVRIPVG